VQRGLDPRRFALFSYGGTAGMHLPICGDELGVSRVVIPYTASVNGAFGLVTSDVVHEDQVTLPQVYPPAPAEMERIFGGLRERVLKQLREDGFANDRISILYSIDMSYRRQVHILTVPMSEAEDPASASAIDAAVARFEQLYREKYGPGSGYREAGIELVTFRARGVGELPKSKLHSDPAGGTDAGHAVVERRDVWVSRNARMESVLGYDFEKLANGNEIPGPAVIWTPITTVVLGPAQVAQVDAQHNLVIARRPTAQAAAQH
jgi:N-methylhydantoinase A